MPAPFPTPIERGRQYGRLTPIELLDPNPKTGATRWRCICTCGREATGQVRDFITAPPSLAVASIERPPVRTSKA
jgi:hypothetical protein